LADGGNGEATSSVGWLCVGSAHALLLAHVAVYTHEAGSNDAAGTASYSSSRVTVAYVPSER
jgi:hypothetical protein